MKVINNFNLLSQEEKEAFAKELIERINQEKVFTDEVNFQVLEILEDDDLDGGLSIVFETEDPLPVNRTGSWQIGDSDELYHVPRFHDVEFENTEAGDIKSSFKAVEATLDGYKLTIDDFESDLEADEVEVDHYSHEDDGIGAYEYWGFTGYDSRPYVAVEGTLLCSGHISGLLYVVRA